MFLQVLKFNNACVLIPADHVQFEPVNAPPTDLSFEIIDAVLLG